MAKKSASELRNRLESVRLTAATRIARRILAEAKAKQRREKTERVGQIDIRSAEIDVIVRQLLDEKEQLAAERKTLTAKPQAEGAPEVAAERQTPAAPPAPEPAVMASAAQTTGEDAIVKDAATVWAGGKPYGVSKANLDVIVKVLNGRTRGILKPRDSKPAMDVIEALERTLPHEVEESDSIDLVWRGGRKERTVRFTLTADGVTFRGVK